MKNFEEKIIPDVSDRAEMKPEGPEAQLKRLIVGRLKFSRRVLKLAHQMSIILDLWK